MSVCRNNTLIGDTSSATWRHRVEVDEAYRSNPNSRAALPAADVPEDADGSLGARVVVDPPELRADGKPTPERVPTVVVWESGRARRDGRRFA